MKKQELQENMACVWRTRMQQIKQQLPQFINECPPGAPYAGTWGNKSRELSNMIDAAKDTWFFVRTYGTEQDRKESRKILEDHYKMLSEYFLADAHIGQNAWTALRQLAEMLLILSEA